MEIDLVVLDLAGTTVEDPGAVNRAFREALRAAGLEAAPGEVDGVMGLPKREAIRRLLRVAAPAGSGEERVEAIHADFTRRMVRVYRDDPGVREIPGTSEVLAALKGAGIKVAVNTGFSREVAQVLLERMDWSSRGLLDASCASDETPRGRPHPDMVLRLMAELGVRSPRRVAKVGDTPVDLEEGTRAGCGLVVGVLSGTSTRAELERSPHTHLIQSVADLPALLGLGGLPDRA